MSNIGTTVRSGSGVMLAVTEAGMILVTVSFYPDARQAGLGQRPLGSEARQILAVHPARRKRGLVYLLNGEYLAQARA
jgi:hypothetical protein